MSAKLRIVFRRSATGPQWEIRFPMRRSLFIGSDRVVDLLWMRYQDHPGYLARGFIEDRSNMTRAAFLRVKTLPDAMAIADDICRRAAAAA